VCGGGGKNASWYFSVDIFRSWWRVGLKRYEELKSDHRGISREGILRGVWDGVRAGLSPAAEREAVWRGGARDVF